MAKRESCLLILVKMVLLTALLIIGIIVGFYYLKGWLNDFFNRGATIEVPDFRGKHLLSVFKEKPPDLIIEKREEKFDPRYPKDYVISQSPDPGTKVKPNKKILLTISMGSKTVIVPDLINKTLREAELALMNAQLKSGNHAYMSNARIQRDRIITQSPLPSTEYEIQGKVDLLISLGLRQSHFHIPSLIGKNLEDAKINIQGWGLRVGKVLFKRDPNRPKMQVIATRPVPYEIVPENAVVDLLISNGTSPDSGPVSEYKNFEFVDNAPSSNWNSTNMLMSNIPPNSPAAPPPPRILLDEEPPRGAVKTAPSDESQTMPTTDIVFVMPDGLTPREVKFFQVSSQGRQQVYAGIHKPLERITVNVPKISGSKVQIYINDVPIEDRPVQ